MTDSKRYDPHLVLEPVAAHSPLRVRPRTKALLRPYLDLLYIQMYDRLVKAYF